MVKKINHFGAFVYLNKDIHGLAHVSEMSEAYPGKTLEELIKAGETYDWKILSIESKSHRMGLVLASKKGKTKVKDEAKDEPKDELKDESRKEKPEKAVKKEKKEEKSK
jgi:ribosomal protein S1